MKENKRSERNERNLENQPLRQSDSNESIREVGQQRREHDNLREADKGSGRSYDYGTPGSERTESERTESDRSNISTGRQQASRETVAGTADMKNNQATGRGRDLKRQAGSGSGLSPKMNVTGSDFDGQNSI